MPPKRKYNKANRGTYKKYGGKAIVNPAATTINRIVKMAVAKQTAKYIETKKSNSTFTDGVDIGHNSFVTVDASVLATTQGVIDPNNTGGLNRIGDEINLTGVAFKMMLENNHRYSDTTFCILVIKSAKGDAPNTSTLFNGLSGNKMMDTLNNERYTVLFSKYVKVKQGNPGGDGALGVGYVGSGLFDGDASLTQSVSTKIVKFYIPGKKFVNKGLVRYENASSQVKFYDYSVLVYAYACGATSDALGWQVGKLNEYIKVMYYKDA